MLTELFTLGVDDVVSDSEDDHNSDHALTASTVAAEVTRARNENGQDDSVQDLTQQAGAPSSCMHTVADA